MGEQSAARRRARMDEAVERPTPVSRETGARQAPRRAQFDVEEEDNSLATEDGATAPGPESTALAEATKTDTPGLAPTPLLPVDDRERFRANAFPSRSIREPWSLPIRKAASERRPPR